jgi:phospholipase/carboxylesterase
MHRYSIVESGTSLEKGTKAIILLHGRGGTADDILILADELCDEDFYVVAPQATGNSWYPRSFLSPEETNEPWLSSALEIVKRLVEEISTVIPRNKIYIAGFSQGACLSLEFAGRYPAGYAGIIAFSGGLIGEMVDPGKYSQGFNGTRIFIGNSDTDPHIPLSRTEESAEILRNLGADVLLRIYRGMGHTVIPQEIEDVKKFMF